jgi:hypothetical protein
MIRRGLARAAIAALTEPSGGRLDSRRPPAGRSDDPRLRLMVKGAMAARGLLAGPAALLRRGRGRAADSESGMMSRQL